MLVNIKACFSTYRGVLNWGLYLVVCFFLGFECSAVVSDFWYLPEIYLVSAIFGTFFWAVFDVRVNRFEQALRRFMKIWVVYLIWLGVGTWVVPGFVFAQQWALVFSSSALFFKIVIAGFYFLVMGLLYLECAHQQYRSLELPFFVNLLFWVFLLVPACYNFLLVFLIMEAITLLLVLIMVVYLIFYSPKTVLSVLQFFVYNVFISIFYLTGVGLLLFLVVPQRAAGLSFINLVMTVDFAAHSALMPMFMVFLKLVVGFWLVTFAFKLTLAPLSNWIVGVYTRLPFLILIILMTVYKIVYFFLFLKIFVSLLNLVPGLFNFWGSIMWFFIMASLFAGCLAYREQDLKTIFAFTTISQLGYIMAGVVVLNTEALKIAVFYLLMYCLQIAAVFVVLILVQKKYRITNLNQLYLLKYYSPAYCYLLVVIFFSFAGVPPLSGFFLKYFLFVYVYSSGFFIIALGGLIAGFVMAIIYFQMILQLLWRKDGEETSLGFEHTKTLVMLTGSREGYSSVVFGFHVFLWGVGVLTVAFMFFFESGLNFCGLCLGCC